MLNYTDTVTFVQATACTFIVLSGILLLNSMTKATTHREKLAFAMLVTAGGSGLVNSFVRTDGLETLFAVAIAIFLQVERRKFHADPGSTAQDIP